VDAQGDFVAVEQQKDNSNASETLDGLMHEQLEIAQRFKRMMELIRSDCPATLRDSIHSKVFTTSIIVCLPIFQSTILPKVVGVVPVSWQMYINNKKKSWEISYDQYIAGEYIALSGPAMTEFLNIVLDEYAFNIKTKSTLPEFVEATLLKIQTWRDAVSHLDDKEGTFMMLLLKYLHYFKTVMIR